MDQRVLIAATLAPAGCAASAECGEVSIDTDTHVNAALLRWTGEGEAVAYTIDGADDATVSGAGAATLLGLPPLAEIAWSLLDADGEAICDGGSFTTGNLDAAFPTVEVTYLDAELVSDEALLLGVAVGRDDASAFALDRQGRWRWSRGSNGLGRASDIEVALDGGGILLANFAGQDSGEDALYRESLLGDQLSVIDLPDGHHGIEQLPDGTVAFPASDTRDWLDDIDGEEISVVADKLVETDGASTTEVFTAWDWGEPYHHDRWDESLYPGSSEWTHANSVRYDDASGSYLMSLANINTVLQIDRASGEVIAEFTGDCTGLSLCYQHDPIWTADGTLLTVNHYDDVGMVAVEYAVVDGALEAVWSYGEDEGIFGHILGQAYRLSNGNTLINFGGAGLIQEVTPDGILAWEVSSELGYAFGNGMMMEDISDAAK